MIVRVLLVLGPIGLIFVFAICAAFIWLPEWITNPLRFNNSNEYFVFLAATRTSLAMLLGNLGTSLGLLGTIATVYATYRSFFASQEKQASDLLAKATELLGSQQPSMRLGGVYTFRRLAQSSSNDYLAVMAILAGFVRSAYRFDPKSAHGLRPGVLWPPQCDVDGQACLTALGERFWKALEQGIGHDVSDVAIRGVSMKGDYSSVCFRRAQLFDVDFSGADLSGADLTDASLTECRFEGTNFRRTCVKGAIFKDVSALSQHQLDLAIGDVTTVLPSDLNHPISWTE